jgi:transcription initiation factor TFIIH subunit 3
VSSLFRVYAAFGLLVDSVMLYSSTEPLTDDSLPLDANSYLPFKLVDSTVVRRIVDELDAIGKLEEERESLSFT